ncbi:MULTISPECIES: hypothetical protein [Bartonella]|uniref:hypothetical protein n=1 Tax=Bartonella TaxID=773 RepID=UPI0018DE0D28|nr:MULTISPECIES: hypothetical protein [Bartonella]MBH9975932.1 hypothetical protein [Bartonella choladocola]MBI0015726.1 hypothetical protein [Bartonella sp. B10834G3]
MKLPFPQKDGVSVLVDTYSDNDIPLAISQVEIIIRGSDVVIRTQDGAELTLVQAAQMSSMHENLFNLTFTDGTVVSSNELFQRADLIEPGPELSEIREKNVKVDPNDPIVAVVQSAPVNETTDFDSDDTTGILNGGGKGNSDERLSVADFLGNPPSVLDDTVSFVPSTTSGGSVQLPTNSPSESMPAPVFPTAPSEPTTPGDSGNGSGDDHGGGHNGDNDDNHGTGDNDGPTGLSFVEKANLYQVSSTRTTVKNDNGTESTVWHLGGGSTAARTNPDLGVQYGEPAILDLRHEADQEKGFVIHADNGAFKYGQVNTENSPNNLDRRLGRIVTFDQLVGGESVAGKRIKDIADIPDGMTIIWKGSPEYADFVAKYGIELKDNEIFVNYKGNVDYNGNNINITWVDGEGKETKAKSEFTNQYSGDNPDTVINDSHAIVLPKTPNAREIYGGSGNDTIYASQFNNHIKYDGEGGTNRLIFGDDYPVTTQQGSNRLPGLTYDVANNKITDTGNGDVAEMHNFTEIVGTRGDDHFLIGDTAASYYFDGRDGNNIFDMQMTNPQSGAINGSSGNNRLYAGAGEDIYNLVNSSGNNTIVDSGKGDSNDSYNFESSTGENKIADSGGSDFYHFDKAINRVEIIDSAAGNDQYQFHEIKDNHVTINDLNDINDGTSLSGSDVYDFATLTSEKPDATDHIENSEVDIVDENGSDKYQFDRTKGGYVSIQDKGPISDKDAAQDEYHFSAAETKVDITDQDGADKYTFDHAKADADNTITVTDKGTADDAYYFNDVTSDSLAEGKDQNVSITDQGGKDEYHFDRVQSKVRLDDLGSGDNYFTFHDAKKSDITINSLNDGIYLGGNDIYDFATLKNNNESATDHIEDTTVAIADENGNDAYNFDRTKGGSVTIKDTGAGSADDRTLAADEYHFSAANTKVDIADKDGADKYDFSNTITSGKNSNTITINDTSDSNYSDDYNFDGTKVATDNDFVTEDGKANIVINDTDGTDHYHFNNINSKVIINDHGAGTDDYTFHEATNSSIVIHDYYDDHSKKLNLDNVYDFATHANNASEKPTDHITNSGVYIIDESGADQYYFERTDGGWVTIVDSAISNGFSTDRDQYYFNDSHTRVEITDGGGADTYNFDRVTLDSYNVIHINDQGGSNSGNDTYNFNNVKAVDAISGEPHIKISDDNGGDRYNFDNLGDANGPVTSVQINDSGNTEDTYNFHNAVNALVNITDNVGTYNDDVYNFAGNYASDTDHITNTTVNIQDGVGQDTYYFNRADQSNINITDYADWQDNYYFNDINNSTVTINDGGGRMGRTGADVFNFNRAQGGSVTITDQSYATRYNFMNVNTKVDITDQHGSDTYNFKNSITSASNTITIHDTNGTLSNDQDKTPVDRYDFSGTTSNGFASDDNYNITIIDKEKGQNFYNFTSAQTKVYIQESGNRNDQYNFTQVHDSIVTIDDSSAYNDPGDLYNFGDGTFDNRIRNTVVNITDGGEADTYSFQYSDSGQADGERGAVTINDKGDALDDPAHPGNGSTHAFSVNDTYLFSNSHSQTVDITDARGSETYDFKDTTIDKVTITDNGDNLTKNGLWDIDSYDFTNSANKETIITDTTGVSNYKFSNSGFVNKDGENVTASSTVKIIDGDSSDVYAFDHSKGEVNIIDGGDNGSTDEQRILYDQNGHIRYTQTDADDYGQIYVPTMGDFHAQTPDDFNFRYSSAKVNIQDGVFANDNSGLPVDDGNSDGNYYFQYSSGETTITNKGGLDKYYLGGSTGKVTVHGGTGTDILYVGKGYLVYDGGTRTDGGRENDWISFQDVLETTDANGNPLDNKVDPNDRTEGIYVNLGANELGYADNNKHNILSHDEHGAVLADGADKGHVSNVENVIGTKFSDLIYGNDKDNYFLATQGNDEYYGGEGSDTYYVGAPDMGGRIEGMFMNPDGTPDDNSADYAQMAAWADRSNLTAGRDNVIIDLDHGYAKTLWKDAHNVQSEDKLHDFENAYGALLYKNTITGRWGTEGRLVGGYKEDVFYSVQNSSKDGISYIDGNDTRVTQAPKNGAQLTVDNLRYDYVTDHGDYIHGVYVKMDEGSSYSGTTIKGYDRNDPTVGTQGKDIFKSIGIISGTKEDDVFEGSAAGGHSFDGVAGNDRFISHGGVKSIYTNGAILDYSQLTAREYLDVLMRDDQSGYITRGGGTEKDELVNVKSIIGTAGDDLVHFTTNRGVPQSYFIGFDGGDGIDYMVKRQGAQGATGPQSYDIGGGFKNVEGFSFIDTYKDTLNVDLDAFFKDFTTGTADSDGHYHAKFFLNGDPNSSDSTADIFNAIDKAGGWDWHKTADDNHGNETWSAQKDGVDTGDTIEVTRGRQGDSHLQESHPSIS